MVLNTACSSCIGKACAADKSSLWRYQYNCLEILLANHYVYPPSFRVGAGVTVTLQADLN